MIPEAFGCLENPSISDYSNLKGEILQCIDELLDIESIPGSFCNELKEKIIANTFNLVVVGQFKRGKTSLINALLGADILPVAVVPLTSIVTIMKYGEALRLLVFFNDGKVVDIAPEDLPDYVTEKGNPRNIRDVSEVVIDYPSPYLKDGVRLIDTPGVGSIYQHNTDVAYHYLPKSDAAVFLLSVDQPMSRAELDFLKDVKEYSNKIFFLLNKADYLNRKDLHESIDFSSGVLKDIMEADARIFPLSAKLALEGKISGSEEMLRQSSLPEFSEALNRFLMGEKGMVLILSVTNNLLRAASQAKFELELEMKSLVTPLDELRGKIEKFDKKKQDVMSEKEDFFLLLDGEAKKIIRNVLEEDLNAIRRELFATASEAFEKTFKESAGMSLKDLRQNLQDRIIADVKEAFAAWRISEDERLAKAFEASCKRFVVKIDETVDALLTFSAELFSIPFDIVKADAVWSTKSGFYYKFNEQPGGIEIAAASLTLLLPKIIGEKIIFRKMKEYLQRVIDMQAARIGYDFEERIERSKLEFRWEMLRRIDATIDGIGASIEKGMSQRSKSEKEVGDRTEVLLELLKCLNAISERLLYVRMQAATRWPQ
ncbi:MAG: dynamin family protein [Dissulfurispiraceae bacterium]|jgi:GTPase SAR1 family protein